MRVTIGDGASMDLKFLGILKRLFCDSKDSLSILVFASTRVVTLFTGTDASKNMCI